MRKISTTVSESGDNIETAQVGSNYKTSNFPDLYSGAPPNVKNYTNKGYIKETAEVRSNCKTSDLPNVYLVTPSNAIVYNKRGDISNFPDVLIGFPEKNGPPKNKVGSSFMKIIAAKKRINAINRCNKNNI